MQSNAYPRRSKAASVRQPLVAYGVNELTDRQRERIVRLVREGMSFRSIERLTGHRRETISRYAKDAGLELSRIRARPVGSRSQ